jgi:hypothetical protein
VTAGAFLLAMLADFTALPAALWMIRRERPRAERTEAAEERDAPERLG